jgi:hypothetical protein
MDRTNAPGGPHDTSGLDTYGIYFALIFWEKPNA